MGETQRDLRLKLTECKRLSMMTYINVLRPVLSRHAVDIRLLFADAALCSCCCMPSLLRSASNVIFLQQLQCFWGLAAANSCLLLYPADWCSYFCLILVFDLVFLHLKTVLCNVVASMGTCEGRQQEFEMFVKRLTFFLL